MAGKLNTDNYDVLFVGASGRQYFQGITERWKGAIKNFISSGGGYVGICGGANIVSMGIENPRYFLDRVINKAALGIVPVYLNISTMIKMRNGSICGKIPGKTTFL